MNASTRPLLNNIFHHLLIFAGVSLILHYPWEILQARFFANMLNLDFWEHARICFVGALGDVLIAAFAYVGAAVVAKNAHWPAARKKKAPFFVWIAIGQFITVAFEKYALATGRWVYGPNMPLLMGIGVSPILQWILIPTFSFVIFRFKFTNEIEKNRLL